MSELAVPHYKGSMFCGFAIAIFLSHCACVLQQDGRMRQSLQAYVSVLRFVQQVIWAMSRPFMMQDKEEHCCFL